MMNIFEPLFLLIVLTAAVSVLTAAGFAVTGRFRRAGRIVTRVVIAAAVYMTIVIAVTLFSGRRVYRVAEERCNDDWCITVTGWQRAAAPGTDVTISLRLRNRARRVPMGERGTVIYLTDAQRRRFDPVADPSELPFTTVLQPGQSIMTTRRFQVPTDARDLGVVYKGEGGFPIGWFVITEGGWFQPPPIVALQPATASR
jgi:hypothetical protein